MIFPKIFYEYFLTNASILFESVNVHLQEIAFFYVIKYMLCKENYMQSGS